MPPRKYIEADDVIQLHCQGYNDIEISKRLNCKPHTICYWRKKLGLPPWPNTMESRLARRKFRITLTKENK